MDNLGWAWREQGNIGGRTISRPTRPTQCLCVGRISRRVRHQHDVGSQLPAERGPERPRRGVLRDYHQMTVVDAVLAQCVEGACGERATDAASAMRALHSEVIHVAAAAVVSAEHGTDYAG